MKFCRSPPRPCRPAVHGRDRKKLRKTRWDRRGDRRKRLSHVGAQGLTSLWGRRFRLPTDFSRAEHRYHIQHSGQRVAHKPGFRWNQRRQVLYRFFGRFSMRWFRWCLCGLALPAIAADRPPIFPEPQKMTVLEKAFSVEEGVPILVPPSAPPADLSLARELLAELSDRYGMALRIDRTATLPSGPFILMGTASNPLVGQYLSAHTSAAPPRKSEAYSLRSGPDAVVVAGNDEAGAFYGMQSVRQLIAKDGGHVRISGAEVDDWPHLPFRAIRLYLPGHENIAFFKRFLRDFMALYKFNKVVMEVNASMRLDRHPELNAGWIDFAKDLYYTQRYNPRGPRIVALRVVQVLGEIDPPGVQFRMAVQAHRRIHFHDHLVEFVQRHEIAQKAFEEGDVLVPRQVETNGPKWQVGPVVHLGSRNAYVTAVLRDELADRLHSIKSPCLIVARHHYGVGTAAQAVGFAFPRRRGGSVGRKILAHERVGGRPHQDERAGRQRGGPVDPQGHAVTIAQFGQQFPGKGEIRRSGARRHQDRNPLLHGKRFFENRHLLRFRKYGWTICRDCGPSEPAQTPTKPAHGKPPEESV